MHRAARLEVLRALGAPAREAEELLRYNENAFTIPASLSLPLDDEPFAAVWDEYAADAQGRGAVAALAERLPQLRFPVAPGMSRTAEYLAATRQGAGPEQGAPALELEAPGEVRLFVHATAAGRIPVIVAERRPDFVALLRALSHRNEPVPISDAQGAAIIAGYVNWDRVARLRAAFEAGLLPLGGARDWSEALQAIRGERALYQDCFILLSAGPYSGVPGEALGIEPDDWLRMSGQIRLAHECAHYFTRRVFGSMRNTLLDEIIADYAGITAAAGAFHAAWFLRFMGLDHADPPLGGRFGNYQGDPPLTPGARTVLATLVRRAAATLEAVDRATAAVSREPAAVRARIATVLAAETLESLADDAAAERIAARVRPATHATNGSRFPPDRAAAPSGGPAASAAE